MKFSRLALGGLLSVVAVASQAATFESTDAFIYKNGSLSNWLAGSNLFYSNEFDGTAPIYTGSGSAPTASITGSVLDGSGSLLLNPDAGSLSVNPVTGTSSLSSMWSLQTNTNASNATGGLAFGTTFLAGAGFTLSTPLAGYSYGIRLSDSFSDSSDVITLRVVGDGSGGAALQLRKRDSVAGTDSLLATQALDTSHPSYELTLALAHETANSNVITAYYGYYDKATDSCVGSCVQALSTTTTAFNGENFTRMQVLAVAPVPEPATYAMLLAGLGLLGVAVRRKG